MSFKNQLKNAHFQFITEVKFKNEKKSIPFKCWTEENKINVKLNIQGGSTISATMNLDYASIFIQEAIPLIMKRESTLIKKYLKNS